MDCNDYKGIIPFGVIGNTTVFGAVVLGSNPGGGAIDKQSKIGYDITMSRITELEDVSLWEDGLRTGASTIIDAIISMLERELYKNKGEDVVYEYAIKAVIKKIEDMKND